MRKWTKSACVVLAWCILPVLVAVGIHNPARPAQAIHSNASSTAQVTLTAFTTEAASAAPAPWYVVQPGDTLSGIATALAVRGGWQALYAANRHAIGPDPNIIRVGTVLAVPGQAAPARYAVESHDTLSGIATALAVRGGWQALYAANRHAIGPDPNIIRVGTVLAVPGQMTRPRLVSKARQPRPSKPAGGARRPAAAATRSAPLERVSGMPQWLKAMLLAVGIVIGLALITEPVVALIRRRARGRHRRLALATAGIVMADHERLIVTYSRQDDTVYVLTPPGEDPRAVLRAARLVLPEEKYQELAGQLGVSANWPLE